MTDVPIWLPSGETVRDARRTNEAVMLTTKCKDLDHRAVEMHDTLCHVCEKEKADKKEKEKRRVSKVK